MKEKETLIKLTITFLFPLLTLIFVLTLLCIELVDNTDKNTNPKSFFPIDENGHSGISAFEEAWFSTHLRAMKEEPLWPLAMDKSAQVYRFTLLPTWDFPQSVRLSKVEDGFVIHYSRLNGQGGYDPGKLAETKSVKLSNAQVSGFLKLFEDVEFFTEDSEDETIGFDGSEWILEAVIEGRYHVVVRWTPDAYDPEKRGTVAFVKACEWLLNHRLLNNAAW